jgi:hypothetical protein
MSEQRSAETLDAAQFRPYNRGDAYWSDTQKSRLQELQRRRDQLSTEERTELEALIAASFDATIAQSRSRVSMNP